MKLCLLLCLVVSVVCLFAAAAPAATTECVSVGLDGGPASSGSVFGVSTSADGRYVAFGSDADNLVVGATNGRSAVYLRDRVTNTTQRISLRATTGGEMGCAAMPSISADGRFVVYSAIIPHAAPEEPCGPFLFLYDRSRRTTQPVTVGRNHRAPTVVVHALSGNGRYVAFSSSDRLLALDADWDDDVYVWDRTTRALSLVSVNSRGQKGNSRSGAAAVSISRDGRYIAFDSTSSNLVAGDADLGEGGLDIFVRDRLLAATECASTNAAGGPGNSALGPAAISANGRFVAFEAGLWPSSLAQVMVRDRMTGALELASTTPSGAPTDSVAGWDLGMSRNGRFVIFTAAADDLVPGWPAEYVNVFVRDRLTQTTQAVSVGDAGQEPLGNSGFGGSLAISNDGACAGFASEAVNLTPEGSAGLFARTGLEWPLPLAEPEP